MGIYLYSEDIICKELETGKSYREPPQGPILISMSVQLDKEGKLMNHGPCPLCGNPGCEWGEDRSGPYAVKYWCQTHCDTFRIGSIFLRHVWWSTITEEDKKAIAAYMYATKGPQRVAPLIHEDNYREYVRKGHLFQKSTP